MDAVLIMGKNLKENVRLVPSSNSESSPLSISTNEEFDRSVVVVGKIIEGTLPLTSTFTVTQLGKREEFIPLDSSDPLQDSEGNIFGVLKK